MFNKIKLYLRYLRNKYKVPNRHPVIVGLLKLIATEQEQLNYEKNVPYVDIGQEIICMWFNDLYIPDDMYFVSYFSKKELIALNEFNCFFEEKKRHLPAAEGTIKTWLNSPIWKEIMTKAEETIRKMDNLKTSGFDLDETS